MKNFLRALKFSWPYRWRIGVSILCASVAAVFWSLNFTAIYPVLKIISTEQNLQEWINESIAKTEEQIKPLVKEVAEKTQALSQLQKDAAGPDRDVKLRKVAGDLAKLESKLEALRHTDYYSKAAKTKIIDKFVPEDRFQTLALVIVLLLAAMTIKGFFDFWQETLVGSVVNRSLYDMRNCFYRKVIHLDVNYFSQGTNELMSRFTNDMELLGTGTKTLFGRVIAEPLRALACVVVACWISWQLTLVFMVLVPVAIYVLMRVGRMMKRATRRQLERMTTIYKILHETFLGIKIVKAFTREAHERQRFRAATKEYYHKAMWVVYLDALAGPVIEVLGVAGVGVAVLAGAYLVVNRQTHIFGIPMTDQPLEAEALLTLYCLLAAVADPVRKLSSVYTRIQSGAAAADRVFNYMDREPRVGANSTGPQLLRHNKDIEFRDICFSYEPGHPILTAVHLDVKFGETVALVGKNGCGKSTLLGLLPRFYDPDHGTIFIDGIDIRSANLRSLRQQVSIVTQDALLFDDTIYNNIAFGRKCVTPEDVEHAARQAKAHDFILRQADGYQTLIGEGGTKLSGGQKQRLTLARAMLRDPSILILDEFTSQTDAETEADIHRVLRDFMRNRTTFVITHRLNTLEIADRIVVIDQGRVIAVGTHQDLLGRCSVYQRLHEAHFQRLVA